jgi:basic membrane protein A
MRGKTMGIAALAALTLLAAACGSDDDGGSGDTAATEAPAASEAPAGSEAPSASEAPASEAPSSEAPAGTDLDSNGDGEVVFGVATAGPRDDGGYYQALVEKVTEFSETNGYADPIIVDNIQAADAATELTNLAEQGVDVIAVGASEIAEPLADLVTQYPDIFWYCNCGAGYPENPGLAQSQDDASEINYSAGYATGLLLKDKGGDSVAFLGCCDLGFEKESYMAYEKGLQAVDPSYTMTYVATGGFPFDFDNTAGATEAFNNAVAQGADAVYPFLGGAHEPIVKLANDAGLITLSAGASDACDRTDLDYQIAVRFDAGDYLDTILAEISDGSFTEGDTRVFHVGVDPEPGAVICDPQGDQQAQMDTVYQDIADGKFAAEFGEIKGTAYANS